MAAQSGQLRGYEWHSGRRTGLAVLAGALAVCLSLPLLFTINGELRDPLLSRLSDVGQAYGALSVILTTFALVGVISSLAYQSRQNRIQGEHARIEAIQAYRASHAELIRMIIDDPATFGPCIGSLEARLSVKEYRQFLFTTLWLNYAQIGFEMGYVGEQRIRREVLGDMFTSPQAQYLYGIRREIYDYDSQGSLRPFVLIVDEEFRRADLAASRPLRAEDPDAPAGALRPPES